VTGGADCEPDVADVEAADGGVADGSVGALSLVVCAWPKMQIAAYPSRRSIALQTL
jgi:hypothetical protein